MFMAKKPDPVAARKELKDNVTKFAIAIVAIRASTVSRRRSEIIGVLLTGLRRLEYRGYDSAGIAIDAAPVRLYQSSTSAAYPPFIIKAPGKISALEEHVQQNLVALEIDGQVEFETHAGIAHTRWATHGPPTAANTHPMSSDSLGEFVVVHNGIITNFRALKDFLLQHGEIFESETDTEVIPKLLKWVYNSLTGPPVSFAQLVMDVMSQLEGAYALLIKSTHYPGELIACKRGSPLILGVKKPHFSSPSGDGGGSPVVAQPSNGNSAAKRRPGVEYFLASDASAVVEHTNRVIVLEDGDVVALKDGTYEIFNCGDYNKKESCGAGFGAAAAAALAPHQRALQTLNMEVSSIMKIGYDHFMQKEIFEQPETVLQTMRGRVRFDVNAPAAAVAAAAGSPVAWTLASTAAAAVENGPAAAHAVHEMPMAMLTSPSKPAGASYSRPSTPPSRGLASTKPAKTPLVSLNNEERIKLGGLSEHLEAMCTGRRLVLIACGTSYHACLASRKALEELVGLPVALELASDLLDRHPPMFRDDTCIFVSQSGETADTLKALEYAKRKGALCVGVTNTVGSAIARGTHCGIHINAGCEIGVASTKAYTSQIVVLVMMALALSGDRVSQKAKREAVIDGLGQLPSALRAVLHLDPEIRQLAERLKSEQSLLVFGRGYNYATALEAALKVKEVALMHSEGILAGEMKHGPLALVDETMPILLIATLDDNHAKMLTVIQQLRARSAKLMVLCCEGDDEVAAAAGPDAVLIRVPAIVDCLQTVVNAIPLQLLSYHLAVLRGHNVDQPRNLAKSVTVTEFN